MGVHACNLNPEEAKAGELGVQSQQHRLHSELKARLEYMKTLSQMSKWINKHIFIFSNGILNITNVPSTE